jgi:hypothetical protein
MKFKKNEVIVLGEGHAPRETGESQLARCVTGAWEENSSQCRPAPSNGTVKLRGECHGV